MDARSHISTVKEKKHLWAAGDQSFYEVVVKNSESKKMVMNPRKTKLVCISPAIYSEVTSFVRIGGDELQSENSMKIVGYTFGRRPGPAAHIEDVRKRVAMRTWIIRNLKRAGVPSGKLVQVYCAVIRPLMEYAVPAFHTLMTKEQSELFERQQRSVMKVIFGMDTPYLECLCIAGIPELSVRRQTIFEEFVMKSYRSPIWRERWYTNKEKSTYSLRHEDLVVQHFAELQCLQHSPLYMMREFVNKQHKLGRIKD